MPVDRDSDPKQRTLQQNKALHKFFTLLAQTLNAGGLDQRKVLKESVDIPWTPEAVKDQLWRPIQEAVMGEESTTHLTTRNINEVYEVLNRYLGEKHSVHVPFPSEEGMRLRERVK